MSEPNPTKSQRRGLDETFEDHVFIQLWSEDESNCGTNWNIGQRGRDPIWRVCHRPIWDGAHRRPLPPPEVGRELPCFLCSRTKPWGTFDSNSGAVVCVECRDAAYSARNIGTAGNRE